LELVSRLKGVVPSTSSPLEYFFKLFLRHATASASVALFASVWPAFFDLPVQEELFSKYQFSVYQFSFLKA
jgi:hypothetical protein